MFPAALTVVPAAFVAFANGANDNFKGVATLHGSRTAGYWRLLAGATAAVFAGSLLSLWAGGRLLARFGGGGLVPEGVVADPAFLPAAGLATAVVVLAFTRLGMPVSTTHALVGGLLGAGAVLGGAGGIDLGVLGGTFLLPLLASPFIALVLTAAVHRTAHAVRVRAGITREWCLCVGRKPAAAPAAASWSGELALEPGVEVPGIGLAPREECRKVYGGRYLGIGVQRIVDGAHVASAVFLSFTRGLNDTPKIAALGLGLAALSPGAAVIAVALAMAAGGLLQARRVAATMSWDITELDTGRGLAANGTAALVTLGASLAGLPVSTTHVSVGSLFGAGATGGGLRRRTLRNIAGSWLLTLPAAVATGGAAAFIMRGVLS